MSDKICGSINSKSDIETTVLAAQIGNFETPGQFGQIIEKMQSQAPVSLPAVDIFENAPDFDQKMEQCIASTKLDANSIGKIVGLSDCDDRFQVLIKDMARSCGLSDQGRQNRSRIAKEIVDYTKRNSHARELMGPFMEQLYNEAFAYFVPQKH